MLNIFANYSYQPIFIANLQRNLLKFGDLRRFYSVVCGIFVRLIVAVIPVGVAAFLVKNEK